MSSYISRDALIEETYKRKMADLSYVYTPAQCDAMRMAFGCMIDVIRYFPVADVAPVVHGKWILKERIYPYCSVCGRPSDYECDGTHAQSLYCPNCGARMDGKEADHAE